MIANTRNPHQGSQVVPTVPRLLPPNPLLAFLWQLSNRLLPLRLNTQISHPLTRLPPEILDYIFELCMTDGMYWNPVEHVPARLSHICSSWRYRVLENPRLWVHLDCSIINQPFSQYRKYCNKIFYLRQHSKFRPLEVSISRIGDEYPFLPPPLAIQAQFSMLSPTANRWKILTIDISFFQNYVFPMMEFPLLEELRILSLSSNYQDEIEYPYSGFIDAPRLRRIVLGDCIDQSLFFPLHQITELRIKLEIFVDALICHPFSHLESLELVCNVIGRGTTMLQPPPPDHDPPFILSIKRFFLDIQFLGYNEPNILWNNLNLMRFPNLTSIQVENGTPTKRRNTEELSLHVQKLVVHSGCAFTIAKLSIPIDHRDPLHLINLLRELENLESLELFSTFIISSWKDEDASRESANWSTLFDTLTYPDSQTRTSPPPPPPIPHLKSLKLWNMYTVDQDFLTMVNSRLDHSLEYILLDFDAFRKLSKRFSSSVTRREFPNDANDDKEKEVFLDSLSQKWLEIRDTMYSFKTEGKMELYTIGESMLTQKHFFDSKPKKPSKIHRIQKIAIGASTLVCIGALVCSNRWVRMVVSIITGIGIALDFLGRY